jgi:threonine dehydratase
MIPSKEQMIAAHEQIKPFIHDTPILSASSIHQLYGNSIYFKCENFQKMGAFKMRGALNALMNLGDLQKSKGVVTHSSGNFAQALSLAAKSIGITAHIVMPESAPEIKKRAVEGYGGIITISESTIEAREKAAQQIVDNLGATFIHPSDNLDVIIGQGTAAKELLEVHGDLSFIFTPVGGGGLIGGSALACKYFGNNTLCYGGEPENADDAKRSLDAGKILKPHHPQTVADGLKTYLGQHNFPIIKALVKDIFLVSEEDIITAMRDIWERMKIIVEPSSAVALAAIKKSGIKDQKIGVIISGGNVDLNRLPF